MLFGYALVLRSESDDVLDNQYRVLRDAGVAEAQLYKDHGFERSGLESCLQNIRPGDTLIVWKLDRLGRGLRHLVGLVSELKQRGVGLKVLTGAGAAIDTTGRNKNQIDGIFSALAELEQNLAVEYAPRAENSESTVMRRAGGRRKMTHIQIRSLQLAMKNPNTNITELCAAYGISRTTLYRYFTPDGELRPKELKLLMDDDGGEIAIPAASLLVQDSRTTNSLIHQYRFLIASLLILAFDAIVNGLLVVHHLKPAVVNLYLPGLFGVILISSMFVPRDKSLFARLSWALLIPEIGSLISFTILSMLFWHQQGYFGSPKGIEPWLMAATVTPLVIAKVWRISLLLISYCGIDYFLFPLSARSEPPAAPA